MRKVQLLFVLLLSFAFGAKAQITNPAPYCACDYDQDYNMFGSVTVNGGTHNTGAEGNVTTDVGYRYFNTQVFPNMNIGANNTISILSYSVEDIEPAYFAVYIDINQNNTFDANEVFLQNNNTINASLNAFAQPDQTLTRTFMLPANAVPGQTRMRVIRGQHTDNNLLMGPYDATYTLAPCRTLPPPPFPGAPFIDNSYGICYDYNVTLAGGGVPVAPVAAFTGNPLNGQTNITNVTFTNQSTNMPTSWTWTFTPNNVAYQNGTSAASQNPVVKFTQAGIYTVALTATNAGGNNTLTKNNYITITNPPPPDAAFTANNLNPTTGVSTVTFTDQSLNMPTGWQWTIAPNTVTYQNGTSAASQNPQVRFNVDGSYTVKLRVTNAFGADSLVKTNYITASPPQAPDAAFTANPLNGVSNGTDITFTDQSLHSPTNWSWTFTPGNVAYQNGTSATSQNPVVKFTQAGMYTTKLVVSNNLGMDSVVKTNYITIVNQPPDADFNVNTTNGNATQTQFNFNDLTANGPTAWTWTFTPNTVTYLNGTNANSQNPQVTFDNPGNYSVKLAASNDNGADSVTKVNYIAVAPAIRAPEADFTADVTNAIRNQTIVSFSDQSDYIPTSWKWTITPNTFVYYNNGNSILQNPKIIFTAAGTYTIKLKATNDLGSDSITKTAYITVTNGTTGIKEQVMDNMLTVFPNPAQDYLNFELQKGVKIRSVAIVSLEGKTITTYNYPKENRVNIASLSKGIYFVKMEFENEKQTVFKKFSKR